MIRGAVASVEAAQGFHKSAQGIFQTCDILATSVHITHTNDDTRSRLNVVATCLCNSHRPSQVTAAKSLGKLSAAAAGDEKVPRICVYPARVWTAHFGTPSRLGFAR